MGFSDIVPQIQTVESEAESSVTLKELMSQGLANADTQTLDTRSVRI